MHPARMFLQGERKGERDRREARRARDRFWTEINRERERTHGEEEKEKCSHGFI